MLLESADEVHSSHAEPFDVERPSFAERSMVATDANASRLSVKYTGARFESSSSRIWTTLDTTGAKREKQKTDATRNRSQARAERDKYKETSGLQRGAYHTETTTDRTREVKDRTTRGTTTARMFTKGNGTDGGRVEAVRPGLELGSLSPTIGKWTAFHPP